MLVEKSQLTIHCKKTEYTIVGKKTDGKMRARNWKCQTQTNAEI